MTFRLGPIPVRVHLSFFITAFLLSGAWQDGSRLLIWVAVVFVSVILHELGHAIAGRTFGLVPQIDLHGMGGTTSWQNARDIGRGKSAIISAAGPVSGLIVGAIVMGLVRSRIVAVPEDSLAEGAVSTILYVNVGWSVFNLVPMLPLDGGNILRAALRSEKQPIRGERIARIISIVVAAAIGGAALLLFRGWYIALLAGIFAYQNVKALGALSALENDAPLHDELARGYQALEKDDAEQVLAIGEGVSKRAKSPAVLAEALQLTAFGYLMTGRVADADAAIARLPVGYKPHAQWLEARARVGS